MVEADPTGSPPRLWAAIACLSRQLPAVAGGSPLKLPPWAATSCLSQRQLAVEADGSPPRLWAAIACLSRQLSAVAGETELRCCLGPSWVACVTQSAQCQCGKVSSDPGKSWACMPGTL